MIISVAFIGLIIAIILKNYSPTFKVFSVLATSIIIFILVFPYFKEVLDIIKEIANVIEGGNFFLKEITKIIAIAYLIEIAAALCNDCGESAIAQKIELAGKIFILYTGQPIILSLLNIVINITMWR